MTLAESNGKRRNHSWQFLILLVGISFCVGWTSSSYFYKNIELEKLQIADSLEVCAAWLKGAESDLEQCRDHSEVIQSKVDKLKEQAEHLDYLQQQSAFQYEALVTSTESEVEAWTKSGRRQFITGLSWLSADRVRIFYDDGHFDGTLDVRVEASPSVMRFSPLPQHANP
ncbi:hypothetical protein [Ferrimonas gelatinilytica]|uniref:Uncharacterized protein n=1 Tax=Ferrimonas gelatinilytica TaxID=1255257 RepID=A0ABP9RZQ2_9GAMM